MDNKYKDMEIKDICCEECLFNELLDRAENLKEDDSLLFFAKYELVRFIIQEFIKTDDYVLENITFDGEFGDYRGEYVVSIDDEKCIWCEPAIRKSGIFSYGYNEHDIAYVYENDVQQAVIDSLLDDECRVVLFGFDEENEEDFDNDSKDDMQGFTETFSNGNSTTIYSFYSNIPDLAKDMHKMLHD